MKDLKHLIYFEKLLEQVPNDVLVLSLSYCIKRNNVICMNACFDTYAVTKFAEGLKKEVELHCIKKRSKNKTIKKLNTASNKKTIPCID